MAAGTYEFKFTKNNTWDGCLGGAFMGSGVEASLSSPGNNIKFTLTEANKVVIRLDVNNRKFILTIGGQIADEPENITIHISVPDNWGNVYGYCWNPDSLGSWPGTQAENGTLVLPAVFDGFIVNNNNGRQTTDIKDIDLTKKEVWITVSSNNTYTLSYEDPNQGGTPIEPPATPNIKIHVIAPDSWDAVYGYSFTPEQCGSWPGMMAENGVINVAASFGGFIVNNGAGAQTADITDIDLTKEEVWIVVAEDCSYKLYYNEADIVLPQPTAKIKIHVIAEHWSNVYAYTYDPANCGSWPGTLASNGYVEAPANFGGLVLSNGAGEQTADITDIDLSKSDVWITVAADNSYTLSYEEPGQEVKPEIHNIKIHMIAPDSWGLVYGYSYTPEQCGSWPGMIAENGVVVTKADFVGFIVNNGEGAQTGDITDIDLTKNEVWIVVAEDCSYQLYYSEADVVLPQPVAKIKIHVIAAHWNAIYAYTFDPVNCGSWPGAQVSDGYVEAPANFGGLVLNNGAGEQTADITDIDLSQAEVWITIHEDNSYEISYSAPAVDDNPGGGELPDTGDALMVSCLILAMSVMGVFCVASKKNL